MEFYLNKIEPEARNKVNEATRDDKVHDKTKDEFKVNPESRENREKTKYSPKKRKDKKDKILVEAKKIDKVEVDASDERSEYKTIGRFLDKKG